MFSASGTISSLGEHSYSFGNQHHFRPVVLHSLSVFIVMVIVTG